MGLCRWWYEEREVNLGRGEEEETTSNKGSFLGSHGSVRARNWCLARPTPLLACSDLCLFYTVHASVSAKKKPPQKRALICQTVRDREDIYFRLSEKKGDVTCWASAKKRRASMR